MARPVLITPDKTYATEGNAHRAVTNKNYPDSVRYTIVWNADGRCYPIFIGTECIALGVHFDFVVIG